jgi:hypothetical protein
MINGSTYNTIPKLYAHNGQFKINLNNSFQLLKISDVTERIMKDLLDTHIARQKIDVQGSLLHYEPSITLRTKSHY